MQIVIDIPDGYYSILNHIKNGSIACIKILDCVKKGKTLPEHHGRLIDADALIEGCNKAIPIIDVINAPTIIETTDKIDNMLEELWNDYDKEGIIE